MRVTTVWHRLDSNFSGKPSRKPGHVTIYLRSHFTAWSRTRNLRVRCPLLYHLCYHSLSEIQFTERVIYSSCPHSTGTLGGGVLWNKWRLVWFGFGHDWSWQCWQWNFDVCGCMQEFLVREVRTVDIETTSTKAIKYPLFFFFCFSFLN